MQTSFSGKFDGNIRFFVSNGKRRSSCIHNCDIERNAGSTPRLLTQTSDVPRIGISFRRKSVVSLVSVCLSDKCIKQNYNFDFVYFLPEIVASRVQSVYTVHAVCALCACSLKWMIHRKINLLFYALVFASSPFVHWTSKRSHGEWVRRCKTTEWEAI